MTEFMRPTVSTEEVNSTVARYIVEPLERGYGNTLGNSMRGEGDGHPGGWRAA